MKRCANCQVRRSSAYLIHCLYLTASLRYIWASYSVANGIETLNCNSDLISFTAQFWQNVCDYMYNSNLSFLFWWGRQGVLMSASHPVDHSVGLCVNFEVGRSEQIGHSEAFVGNLLVPNMRPNWLKGRIINSFAHSNHHSRSSNEWPGKVNIDFIEFQPLPRQI